jgi:hypothetical protein
MEETHSLDLPKPDADLPKPDAVVRPSPPKKAPTQRTQQEFWRQEVQSRPIENRLAYIESHFPGSYGCGFEEGIFYPLPAEDAGILQSLWEETYREIFGRRASPDKDGPAAKWRATSPGGLPEPPHR